MAASSQAVSHMTVSLNHSAAVFTETLFKEFEIHPLGYSSTTDSLPSEYVLCQWKTLAHVMFSLS